MRQQINIRAAICCAAVSLTPASSIFAQAVDSSRGEGTADEVVVLSPFRVEGSEDQGYQATSSLAGTRLRTPLRDIGSAVSVLTGAMFTDTGATNAETILSYATSMEVGGEQGNFANGLGSNNNGRAEQDVQRANPQSTQRVRGLASASLTRDFFLTDIPFDSYNTGRVDISRGANSLLFGVGAPGGIINNDLNKAHVNVEDFAEVSLRVGERSSHRETFDYHKQLVRDRFAIRLAGVYSDTQFNQRPAYELDKRVYGAFEAVLFKNDKSRYVGRTILTGNVEYGTINANPVNILPPGDGITDWFQRPDIERLRHVPGVVIPGYLDPEKPTEPARNHPAIGATEWEPKQTFDTRYGIGRPTAPNVVERIADRSVSIMFPGVSATHPVWGDAQGMTHTLYRSPINNQGPATGGRTFDFLTTMPFFGGNRNGQQVPNFTPRVIMDREIWDNPNRLITGSTNRRLAKFDAENLTLEQTFFDESVGIELAYDRQSYRQDHTIPFSSGEIVGDNHSGEIVIDVSEYLGNFERNPNVGRPMMSDVGIPKNEFRSTERTAKRATAFYDLNFERMTKRFGWLLGRHTFTGVYNEQSIEDFSRSYLGKWDNVAGSDIGNSDLINNPLEGGFRSTVVSVYMGPSLLDPAITTPSQVVIDGPINVVLPRDGDFYSVDIWNRTAQAFERHDVVARSILVGGGRRKQVLDTEVLSWQGRFFRDHLVALYGWRRDRSNTFENIPNENNLGIPLRLPSGEINPNRFVLEDVASTRQEGETITWSVVGHAPQKWTSRLPFNMDLSVHLSESENFQPSATRRSILGEVLDPPTGETKEMGFSLQFLDGRISTRFNWYETASSNSSVALGTASGIISWGATAGISRWSEARDSGMTIDQALVAAGGTAGMFGSYEDIFAHFISWLPSEIQQLRNIRVVNGIIEQEPNPGEAATQDFVSKGLEIELVANVTRNWRVSMNVSKQEAITSNTAVEHRRVAAEIAANMAASPVGAMLDTPHRQELLTFNQRYLSQVISPLAALQARDDTLTLELREWRVNFINNYSFTEGALKGVGLGGALRWQSENAVGYPNLLDDFGNVVPDVNRPYMGPAELNGDFWVSYKRKLTSSIDWTIQLNVRNAIGDNDYIPVVINPDGTRAVVRNPNPLAIFVTNTFRF